MNKVIEFFNKYIVDINLILMGDMYSIITLIFKVLIFIAVGFGVFSFIHYIIKYHILEMIFTKIKNDIYAYDRVRRKQMRMEIEQKEELFTTTEKVSFISRIYDFIAQSGIVEKIPGFSETLFLLSITVFSIILFGVLLYTRGIIVAIVITLGILVVLYYSLSLSIYTRRISVEKQLLQLSNACASASMQYSNIIDIFGTIYDQFSGVLREGLEACYVEAKQTNNTEQALHNLKRRIKSKQFLFLVNNFELCSAITGNYYAVAKDISDTISIYSKSHEKKTALLRNAKVEIMIIFGVSLGILASLAGFTGNLKDLLLHDTIGTVSIVAMVIILFYGFNMKADRG